MKILIVTQYFWPENFLINSLCSEFQKRGHEVTVLTGLPNYPQGSLFKGYSFWRGPWVQHYDGVAVHRVPLKPRGKGFLNLALNYISFVFFGIVFGVFRTPKRHDVVFCYAPSPITACLPAIFFRWWISAPLVFWVQDLWPESVAAVGGTKSSSALKLIGAVVKYIYSRCDVIMVQSRAFRESVMSWGGEDRKIQYVPNWAKIPGPLKHKPEWLADIPKGFKIVFAGNIGKAQDMPTVLDAAELLKSQSDIHWLIVGDGSESGFVNDEVAKRSLKGCVHTYGRRPSEDMPALYEEGDLMLVSLSDENIFSLTIPSKVQGYMACAKPIVAALNGEGARIIREANSGISAPAGDAKSLANAVMSLYSMPKEQLQQMGTNGFEYFKNQFEESVVVQQIEKICMEASKAYKS